MFKLKRKISVRLPFFSWVGSIIVFLLFIPLFNYANVSGYQDIFLIWWLFDIFFGIVAFVSLLVSIYQSRKMGHAIKDISENNIISIAENRDVPKEVAWTFYKNPKAWIVFGVIIGILLFLGVPQNLYKEITLRMMLADFTAQGRKNDCAGIYNYLLPSEKTDTSLDSFVARCSKNKLYSLEVTINSIEIRGNEAYVNRTTDICYSEACTGKDRFNNTFLAKYYYVNGGWYYSQKTGVILCKREQPYLMLPEFQRAISLYMQRLSEDTRSNEEFGYYSQLKGIINCVDVQYAATDSDLNGAEGVFAFNKDSSIDHLQIFVLSAYQSKDDILTATLLAHELTHALHHADGSDKTLTCYENEADAFNNEFSFPFILNTEERNSLLSRINTDSSQDASSLAYTYNTIYRTDGNNFYEKALQYVKQSPFYQKQCGI